MTDATLTAPETSAAPGAPTAAPPATGSVALVHRRGRWIDGWDPENLDQWEGPGRAIAKRNLVWSIFAEFLGFVVWQLWSIVAVLLPTAGFTLDSSQIFWLISIPSLVGATLRIPYTFLVPIFGGRNWTIISAGLLLIPAIAMAICVGNPETPFPVLLLVAAFAGFGGGNFASSMSNITYFYPQREKGWALGLNAAGGNLGASVAQFVVPIVVTIGAGVAVNLPLAGLDLGSAHPRRDDRCRAAHEQHLVGQSGLLRLGRRASRTSPVDALAPVHRHLRLVHRVRERLPQAHRRPVPGLLQHRGGNGGGLARLPRRSGRLPRPSSRRPSGRPLRRRAGDDRSLRSDGDHDPRGHDRDPDGPVLALPRLLPAAVRRRGRRQRLDVPDGPGRLRAARLAATPPPAATSRPSARRRRRSG